MNQVNSKHALKTPSSASVVSVRREDAEYINTDYDLRKPPDHFLVVGLQPPKRSSSTMVVKDKDNENDQPLRRSRLQNEELIIDAESDSEDESEVNHNFVKPPRGSLDASFKSTQRDGVN